MFREGSSRESGASMSDRGPEAVVCDALCCPRGEDTASDTEVKFFHCIRILAWWGKDILLVVARHGRSDVAHELVILMVHFHDWVSICQE